MISRFYLFFPNGEEQRMSYCFQDDADMRLAMSEDDDYTLPKDNAELTTTGRNGIDNNGTSESTKRVEVCTQKTASFASTPELPKTNTSKYSKYWEK